MSGPSPSPVPEDMPGWQRFEIQSPSAGPVWQQTQDRYLTEQQTADKRLPGNSGQA